MATMRTNSRLQVGSTSWVAEERASAMQLADAESEEFSFSARNEVDWLNEHMAEIFSKNQVNVAEIFKTPGKLRGKTPKTARKLNPLDARTPLSDIFSASSRGPQSPFKQLHFERPVPAFQVAEDEPEQVIEVAGPLMQPKIQSPPKPTNNPFDSGYYGSQAESATQPTQVNSPSVYRRERQATPIEEAEAESESDENVVVISRDSDQRRSSGSFATAKEEQTRKLELVALETQPEELSEEKEEEEVAATTEPHYVVYPILESPAQTRMEQFPQKRSPQRATTAQLSPPKESPLKEVGLLVQQPALEPEDEHMDDAQSPSEGSSPLRPIVRKSSLNFASLPAREPLTTKKSIGNRVSRTSQIEQSRTSYYGRHTGGGTASLDDEEDDDEMEVDSFETSGTVKDDSDSKLTRLHNKTSTQRLQDQISMLGQSQSTVRPTKSIASSGALQSQPAQPTIATASQDARREKSPERKSKPPPGAFPEDEDSWIGPPTAAPTEPAIFSPRPQLKKSHTTDVMEAIHGKDNIGGSQFNIPKRGEPQKNTSPIREPLLVERTTVKSVSTSVLRSPRKAGDSPALKIVSVSNPNPPSRDSEESTSPPKSPSRSFKGSPLKAAKDKFSSILKTSRGLFASSAAVSAEAKSSALSPASSRIAMQSQQSFEDVLSHSGNRSPSRQTVENKNSFHSLRMPNSPTKSPRKTRASTEREEKRREQAAREAKEAKAAQAAQKMDEQLERARMKVREEAKVFHLEQERVAAMQKEVEARKEQERQAKASQVDVPRATRSSPRKTKAQLEAEGIAAAAASTDDLTSRDTDMTDVSHTMPPPTLPRPKSQIGRPQAKRPLKPAKDAGKAKPPTVIRVDTGSQRGHQYHPSNATLAATLQESLVSSQQTVPSHALKHKASTSSIQSKVSSSSNNFKSAATKALEAAARKKEQDEQAAARKKEAKLELERQRAVIKEEERRKEEQHRRQEAERQREIQRERERIASIADAKKTASRQAMEKRRLEMEKAKETRAPPAAIRPQQNGDASSSVLQEKALPAIPAQRGDLSQSKAPTTNTQRTQEEFKRSVNAVLHNTTKAPPKRPLQQDDEHHSRPTIQRDGPSYRTEHQSKRRKTDEDFDDDDITETQLKMTAPPIRQSSIRQKEAPKSLFPSGYANAPASSNLQRSTLIAQHNMNQSRPIHLMDMAQVSKAPIPFASSSNQGNAQPHKTPARAVQPTGPGKSAGKSAKSSPRYQNGENIELPEIHTDSEDDDSDAGDFVAQPWTDSPALRQQLAMQEGMDPTAVFGNPGALNMEEVFSKSKDRFHKFRARTSSANWSGQDRLTQDEINKDLEARDKVRRQGGWTYDTMV